MSVPGTMKNAPPTPVRAKYHSDPNIRKWAAQIEPTLQQNGALVGYAYVLGQCSVLVAREPVAQDGSYRWHLSIAHEDRYPTWDEIKTARYGIPELADVRLMVQLLPAMVDGMHWTNAHENCFHLYEIDADAYNLWVT